MAAIPLLIHFIAAGTGKAAAGTLAGFTALKRLDGLLRGRDIFTAHMAAIPLLIHFIAAGMGKAAAGALAGFPALKRLDGLLRRRYAFTAHTAAFALLFYFIAAPVQILDSPGRLVLQSR